MSGGRVEYSGFLLRVLRRRHSKDDPRHQSHWHGRFVSLRKVNPGAETSDMQSRPVQSGLRRKLGRVEHMAETCLQTRHFEITRPGDALGKPCLEKHGAVQSRGCNHGSCSMDCIVSDWLATGKCSKPCDGGIQHYSRSIEVAARGRGQTCPELSKVEDCNTHVCRYHEVLRKVRSSLANFSSDEPVVKIVEEEAEGFRSLVKTSHDLLDASGKEWASFVANMRSLSREYHGGRKNLYRALSQLKVLADGAPHKLESLVDDLRNGRLDNALLNFHKLCGKFNHVQRQVQEVDKAFTSMEVKVVEYRETAMDQAEGYRETQKNYRELGLTGPVESTAFQHFALKPGADHRGSDITCGRFSSPQALASECLRDPTCSAFTIRNGSPWCMKHLHYDSGEIQDPTHELYLKFQQQGGEVQTPQKVEHYLSRWTFASSFLKKVEKVVNTVVKKVGHIETQLHEMSLTLEELEGMLSADPGASSHVDDLVHDITVEFGSIADYLNRML